VTISSAHSSVPAKGPSRSRRYRWPLVAYRSAYQQIYQPTDICPGQVEAHDWIRQPGQSELSNLSPFLAASRCKKLILALPDQVIVGLSDEFIQLLPQYQIEVLVLEGGEILQLEALLQGSNCLRHLILNSNLPQLDDRQLSQLATAHQSLLRLELSAENQWLLDSNSNQSLIASNQLKLAHDPQFSRQPNRDFKPDSQLQLSQADYVLTHFESQLDLLAVARSAKRVGYQQLAPSYCQAAGKQQSARLTEVKARLQPAEANLAALHWLKHHRPCPDSQLITQLAVLTDCHPQPQIRRLAGQVYQQYFPLGFHGRQQISSLGQPAERRSRLLLPQLLEPNLEAKLFVQLAWQLEPTETLRLILDHDLLTLRQQLLQQGIGYWQWSVANQQLQAWQSGRSEVRLLDPSQLGPDLPPPQLASLGRQLLQVSHWTRSRVQMDYLLLDWARLRLKGLAAATSQPRDLF